MLKRWQVLKQKYLQIDKNLAISSVLTILAYVVIHALWKKGTALPETVFTQKSYFISAWTQGQFYWAVIPGLFLFVISLKRIKWASFEQAQLLKVLVLVLCLIIAFEFFFIDINHYYGQTHVFDRVLLLGLALGLLWHPGVIFLFLIQALLTWQQYQLPLGWQFWTDLRGAFEPSILFGAFVAIRIWRKMEARDYLFLMLCLLASLYFVAGLAKILISDHGYEWAMYNKIGNLFVSSHTYGWWPGLSAEQVGKIGKYLNNWSLVMTTGTIVLELSFLIIFWRKKVAIGLLIGIVLLHLMIFISSGIFFWPWMTVDICLIIILWKVDKGPQSIFKPTSLVLSVLIILGSFVYFRSAPLGWFDSNICTHYEIDVQTDQGRLIRLNKNFMAPYDLIFTQSRLRYVDSAKVITDTHGTLTLNPLEVLPRSVSRYIKEKLGMKTGVGDNNVELSNFQLLSHLNKAQDTLAAQKMLESYGTNYFNQEKKENLAHFFQEYFKHYNLSGKKSFLGIHMPHHIIDNDHLGPMKEEKIDKVKLIRIRSFFSSKELLFFDQKIVMEVEIFQ